MPHDFDIIHKEALGSFLKDRDVHCPVCQYNLRNCANDQCPECGKPIRLAVVALNLSLQAWAILTFVLSLAAGLGVLFITMWIVDGLPQGPAREGQRLAIFGFMAMVPLATCMIVFRHRFLRMPRNTQILCAVVGTLVVIGLFILLSMTMMQP